MSGTRLVLFGLLIAGPPAVQAEGLKVDPKIINAHLKNVGRDMRPGKKEVVDKLVEADLVVIGRFVEEVEFQHAVFTGHVNAHVETNQDLANLLGEAWRRYRRVNPDWEKPLDTKVYAASLKDFVPVKFTCEPEKVILKVDGKARKPPVTVFLSTQRKYEIVAEAEGYDPLKTSYTPEKACDYKITLKMTKK